MKCRVCSSKMVVSKNRAGFHYWICTNGDCSFELDVPNLTEEQCKLIELAFPSSSGLVRGLLDIIDDLTAGDVDALLKGEKRAYDIELFRKIDSGFLE